MPDPIDDLRFEALERQVTWLFRLSIAQLCCLAYLVWMSFKMTFLSMILFAGLVAFIWFFRKQIPGWSGQLVRYVYSRSSSGNSSDPTIM